jgi:hypothetical protein
MGKVLSQHSRTPLQSHHYGVEFESTLKLETRLPQQNATSTL